MNIVSTTAPQVLIATPKDLSFDTLTIINETTNESEVVEYSLNDYDYYVTLTVDLELTENTFYTFSLGDAYKGRFFCTNQTPENYSVQHNRYTEHTTTNNYIVI